MEMGRKVSGWQREKKHLYRWESLSEEATIGSRLVVFTGEPSGFLSLGLSFEVVKLIYLYSFHGQDINESNRERYENKNKMENDKLCC
jgi:hypothetical protein